MPQPQERDLAETSRQLARWLEARLPGARDLRISGLRGPSETGFSSDTLIFDLRGHGPDGPLEEALVARLEPRGFRVFQHYDLSIQVRVLDALATTDVPVPKVRGYEPDPGPLGTSFYVMDRIDGRVPPDTPPYHTAGWVSELPPSQRAQIWWSGFDAMLAVHRVDWRALDLGFLDRPEYGDGPLDQQLGEYDAYMTWGLPQRADFPLLERAYAFLRAERPPDGPTSLCWGDSRPGNQIFAGLDCAAVLDWEMVRLGDAVDDLAWWISVDRCFSEGIGAPRLEGLPDRAATVARWEERLGRKAEHLDYYEVFALFRFSVIMARVVMRLKHYEIFPADSGMDVVNLASVTLERKLAELGV